MLPYRDLTGICNAQAIMLPEGEAMVLQHVFCLTRLICACSRSRVDTDALFFLIMCTGLLLLSQCVSSSLLRYSSLENNGVSGSRAG
jgi:hypothetical protein